MALNSSSRETSARIHSTHRKTRKKLWLCPHESLGFQEAQNLLATRGSRKTCGRTSCHNTFTHVFMKDRVRSSGSKVLQLITSVNLFDIPCPSDEPEEACQLYCSLDRVATILHGLDLPICSHLKISSNVVLSQLDLRSISILEEHEYLDRCQCCARSPSTYTLFRSPCCNASHCIACFKSRNTKTAFFLQASKILKRGRINRLNIRFNIVRNLGSLQKPKDPAWLNHTSTNINLHQMAAAWQEWDAKFVAIHHLRRDWLHDLVPCHAKQKGLVLDGKRTRSPKQSDPLPRRYRQRQNGHWSTIRESWRHEKEHWQVKKTLESTAKEHFHDVAVSPHTDWLVQSVRKFGLRQTLKCVWDQQTKPLSPYMAQQRHDRNAITQGMDYPYRYSRSARRDMWKLARIQNILELMEEDEASEVRVCLGG